MPTFVLNDENRINTYGFRVRNAGLSLDRFRTNPVMLDAHINSNQTVLGRWGNIRIEGSQLLADSEFDSEDPAVSIISGKVDRGFIKGASLGLIFEYEGMVRQPDGIWDLEISEVLEATICAVPSNSGAIALYARNGDLIAEPAIKLSLQKLSKDFKQTNNPTMEKTILSAAAISVLVGMSVTATDDVTQISNALVKLNAEKTAAESQLSALQTKLDAQAKTQAEALVDGAIAEEKLTAGDREEWVELALSNYKLAAKQIGKMQGRESLNSKVTNTTLTAGGVKTIDDFEKLTDEKKLSFKKDSPEAYRALFASKL